MRRSAANEVLAALYLRLNGYFTTGLILHSPEWGESQGEIDCLAIRHPYHSQADRDLGMNDFLNGQKEITDLILCEVKSDPNQLHLNESIRTEPKALRAMLQWAGILCGEQVEAVVCQLQPLLREDVAAHPARIGVREGPVRVRALLSCPPLAGPVWDRWILTGDEILRYADPCFNPAEPRASCSTRYNFQQWGYPFTPIVQWLKERPHPMTLEALYDQLGAK
jgi:hypothetical protein